MKTELTEKALREGKTFVFDNEKHQISIEGDDLRAAEVKFREPTGQWNWASEFHLWFNGELIHTCKTFKSVNNRLNKLIEKWHLELTDIEE
jgi:hypothetical protein